MGWYDEHGPLATTQVTPDGDYTRTGIRFNDQGYSNNPHHRQYLVGPERSGLYYLHARSVSGEFFLFFFFFFSFAGFFADSCCLLSCSIFRQACFAPSGSMLRVKTLWRRSGPGSTPCLKRCGL